MTALVSDFGIARLVSTVGVVDNLGNSTANLLCGSIGYIAPGTNVSYASYAFQKYNTNCFQILLFSKHKSFSVF
jgi:hypothetical protein